jgi:hypothetical protein
MEPVRKLSLLSMLVLSATMAGCGKEKPADSPDESTNDGPVEKAGEEVDEAAEDTKEGAEKAGEKVEEAAEDAVETVKDAGT